MTETEGRSQQVGGDRPSRGDSPTVVGATPAPAHQFTDRPMPICFWVPGDPVPWPRTRVSRNGRFYLAQRIKTWKATIAAYALPERVKHGMLTGPVTLSLWFQLRHNRGDIDNYAKAVMDALTGVLYRDDRQVHELKARFREGGSGVSIHLARIE